MLIINRESPVVQRFKYRLVTVENYVFDGALKIHDLKMQDLKMTDQIAWHDAENAASELSDGPTRRAWKCCWFHYAQSIIKRLQKLGLKDEYYEVFCFWNIYDKAFNTVLASFSVQYALEFFSIVVSFPIFFITSFN